ncbi:hypothetical protein [Microbacterium lacticum]
MQSYLIEKLLDGGSPDGVVAGRMFGAEALLLNGKAIVCAKRVMIGFKLGAGTAAHSEALALSGSKLFDPSGKHRPFRDWVAIPFDSSEAAPDLLSLAIAYATEHN